MRSLISMGKTAFQAHKYMEEQEQYPWETLKQRYREREKDNT